MDWKTKKEKIIDTALSLEKFEIKDLAWNKKNALKMIRSIMNDDIGIFGGDVYKISPKSLEPLIDNWSCEPICEEMRNDFFSRSKKESLDYIEKYPINSNENIVFGIVFTEKMEKSQ